MYEKAIIIYKDMIKEKIYGDKVFYNILLSGLVYGYYICEACDIVVDVVENCKNLFFLH